jgi:hypothetical protein
MDKTIFATNKGKTTVAFKCAMDCQIGAYSLKEGESLKAISNGYGLFDLYVDWGDGSIGRLNARDVNKLAGQEVVGG